MGTPHPTFRRSAAIRLSLAGLSIAISALAAGCGEEPPEARYIDENASGQGANAPASPSEAPTASPSEPAASATDPAPAPPAGPTIAGLVWTVPEGWQRRDPSSPMRQAEFTVPSTAAAEVVVFCFGPGQGGTVDDNIERWARMVLDDQGKPVIPEIDTLGAHGLIITTSYARGEYQSGMPGATPTPLANHALLAAAVEGGPAGAVYIRMTGPADVVAEHREAFMGMVSSLRIPAGATAPL